MISRVVIKLSGEALGGKGAAAYDDDLIRNIAGQIKRLKEVQISIVVGGGNFWRGCSDASVLCRSRSDQIGMLATVMNGIYLSENFKAMGVSSRVMTPFQVGSFTHLFSRDDALNAMSRGETVIFSGGTGHPYFSTDTIAALRAAELDAGCVLYAKNVDGIYDSDPKKNALAKKYRALSYSEVLAKQLKAIDLSAMSISSEAGIDSFVFGLGEEDSIVRACLIAGECYPEDAAPLGTRVSANCNKEEFYV
ncbi:MAG: uridine monophosphate kinase [Clostridiales bacterium]|jgi:uridylate kinase|nr:uridine monophosphate kinase [Clostridiales bacterium]